MKIINKIMIVVLILLILLIPFKAYASNVSINQITSQGTPIDFEDGILTKEITKIEGNKVTIELNLSIHDKKVISSDSEILFLLDNSSSMYTMLEDNVTTRRAKIASSTKELIEKINYNNSKVKMGIMSFSSSTQVIQDFTNDKSTLLNACDNFVAQTWIGSTNMATALRVAKKKFTSKAKNKILVLLTDGLPTDGANATKVQLQDEKVYIISMLVGMNNATQAQISEVFGSEENPTADKFYNIADQEIETVISNDIYEKILEDFKAPISNIVIKDYFPKEIVENFDITVDQPTKGEANRSDDSILWSIDELAKQENATLTYTLKLKEEYDSSLVEKILNTNQKVELNIKNMLGNEENKIMIDSPQIQIMINKIVEDNKEEGSEKESEEQTPEEDKKQDESEKEPEEQTPEEDKKENEPEKEPEEQTPEEDKKQDEPEKQPEEQTPEEDKKQDEPEKQPEEQTPEEDKKQDEPEKKPEEQTPEEDQKQDEPEKEPEEQTPEEDKKQDEPEKKPEEQTPEEDKKENELEKEPEEQTPEEDKKQDEPEKKPEIPKPEKNKQTEKITKNESIQNIDNTVKQDEENCAKTTLPFAGNSKIILLPIGLVIVRLIILKRKIDSM